MLTISHSNGIFRVTVGPFRYQGRTLEKALMNALASDTTGVGPTQNDIYVTALTLENLVTKGPDNTQIETREP